MKNTVYPIILILLFTAFRGNAQSVSNRSAQINKIADKIETYYIFEDIGKALSEQLKNEGENKTFDGLTHQEFADSLSSYLARNGNDRHFNVLYNPLPEKEALNKKEVMKLFDAINRQWNYGFEKVSRLDGNIGYIQYTGFPPSNKQARESLKATMDLVSNTNALIIDLRDNNGGDSKMVELFLGYFFKKRIKLSNNYTRHNNKTSKSFTNRKGRGKTYLRKPVYILVNNRTISAAEGFAYELQQRIGATIIGEKTYGAANPIQVFSIDGTFDLFVPVTEVKNTITQTNWEHQGVKRDLEIAHEKALAMAQILALEKFLVQKIKTELTPLEIENKLLDLRTELKTNF